MTTTPRTCLVTGASRGIGRAVAASLAGDGHRLALVARGADGLADTAAALPGQALTVTADLTDPTAAEKVFAAVEENLGAVDVLVANAGQGSSAPLHRTTDELWARMLDVNLTSVFRCMRRAVPGMVERGYGRGIVIASASSKVGAPYVSAYTAAKHGVLGLVRSVAMEVAGTGVTVNAICPGYVDTPLTDATVANISATTGMTEDAARARLVAMHPIGRLIEPGEVATVVRMLLDSPAITGQGINVDGGAVQS